jgi:hypothetical protein
MRVQINHPARLSRAEQFMLVADFVRTVERAKEGDADARVTAYLMYNEWKRELSEATRGMTDKRTLEAFKWWLLCELEGERRMESFKPNIDAEKRRNLFLYKLAVESLMKHNAKAGQG